MVNSNNKKTKEEHVFFGKDPMPAADLARHAAAVVALHGVASSRPLHQLLPPQFKDLWYQLDTEAKQKEVHDQERQKEEVEQKERQEHLEKRLAKLPQVFMSPTARQLVENVLKKLREGKDEVHDFAREEREEVVGETNGGRGHQQMLKRLMRMGWRKEDVLDALRETRGKVGQRANEKAKGGTQASEGADSSVSEYSLPVAIDWLCLHVNEEALPKEFRPAKTLEIGVTAFAKSAAKIQQADASDSSVGPSTQSHDAPVEDGVQPSAAMLELLTLGFTKTECEETLARYDGSVHRAWQELYVRAAGQTLGEKLAGGKQSAFEELRKMETSATAEEINEQRQEEVLALEAILGDDFEQNIPFTIGEEKESTSCGLRIPVADSALDLDLPSRFSAVRKLSWERVCIEVFLLVHPQSYYPYQLPIIKPYLQGLSPNPQTAPPAQQREVIGLVTKINARLTRELIKQADQCLGGPMVYSLALWLQGALQDIMREVLADDLEAGKQPSVPVLDGPAMKPKPSPLQVPSAASDHPIRRDARARGRGGSNKKRTNRPMSKGEEAVVSTQLKEEMLAKSQEKKYQDMLKWRQQLPAWNKKKEITSTVREHQVIVLTGATGCGKSTQVPQFLLEDAVESLQGARCRILVAQPRRISAIGLAQRVSDERCDAIGRSVGYHIRLETKKSAATRILFCTTGILLRMLAGGGEQEGGEAEKSTRQLQGVTHVIVDEVHERSVDGDFLLVILRRLLHQRPDLKVILMSATVEAELFSNYFKSSGRPAPIVKVPGFTHPVREFFLEDVLELLGPTTCEDLVEGRKRAGRAFRKKKSKTAKEEEERRRTEIDRSYSSYNPATRLALSIYDGEERTDLDLLEEAIWYICDNKEKFPELEGKGSTVRGEANAILVFLAGMADILNMCDRLKRGASARGGTGRYWIIPLHSSLSSTQQQRVFDRPPSGVRKIILSTNIAETSVTIDDIVAVVDSGRMNETQLDSRRNMSRLVETWVGQANAQQRRGRAGRSRPGICLRLFSRAQASTFLMQRPPEILRVPLEQLCLQLKLIDSNCPVSQFLKEALEPPGQPAIAAALKTLREAGAMEDEGEKLTPLGRHLAGLPVAVEVGKLLIYGAIFHCVDAALTLAAFLSSRSPFFHPSEGPERDAADAARLAFGSRGSCSDHLLLLRAYDGWLAARARGQESAFCAQNFLSRAGLQAIADLKRQYAELLGDIGFLPRAMSHREIKRLAKHDAASTSGGAVVRGSDGVREAVGAEADAHSSQEAVVVAVLCAALYPRVVRVAAPDKTYQQLVPGTVAKPLLPKQIKFYTRDDGRVFLHPRSVNYREAEFASPWLLYSERIQTSRGPVATDSNRGTGSTASTSSAAPDDGARVQIVSSSMMRHYPLLLFGGHIDVVHLHKIIRVDGWIQFRADSRIAVLIREVRAELDKLLVRKVADPRLDIGSSGVVRLIVSLILTDGLIGPQEAQLWI